MKRASYFAYTLGFLTVFGIEFAQSAECSQIAKIFPIKSPVLAYTYVADPFQISYHFQLLAEISSQSFESLANRWFQIAPKGEDGQVILWAHMGPEQKTAYLSNLLELKEAFVAAVDRVLPQESVPFRISGGIALSRSLKDLLHRYCEDNIQRFLSESPGADD